MIYRWMSLFKIVGPIIIISRCVRETTALHTFLPEVSLAGEMKWRQVLDVHTPYSMFFRVLIDPCECEYTWFSVEFQWYERCIHMCMPYDSGDKH